MYSQSGGILYILGVFVSTSTANDCRPFALSLPFEGSTLSNGAVTRGVSWQIGSPSAQTISLLPSASYNDTYVYGGRGLCASNVTIEECTTYRGGIYDTTRSDSEKTGAQAKHDFDDATAAWITDKVMLQDSTNQDTELNPHEFGVRAGTSHPFVNKGELGLGKNSSLLNALASGQKIASKSYSFFWGIDSTISDDPRNGSLTLGGYDQALVGDAQNTTTKFNRNQWKCREGMVVDLTGLALQSESGGTQNLLNGTEKLQACVVPTLSSVLTLPQQIWNNMAKAMGVEMSPLNNGESNGLFYHVSSIKPESASFTGNLSISINSAITVVIPNKQLIFNEAYIASNGRITLNSSSKNVPIVRYTELNGNMPRIGGMFFSSAYLMVNHDKNEFAIAPVQGKPAAQKLMGIDTANACIAPAERGVKTVPEAPTSSSNIAATSKRTSNGAIAGIVVGIVAVICFVAGICILIWRRRRAPVTATVAVPYPSELGTNLDEGRVAEKYGYTVSEMYAGSTVGELSSHTSDLAVELDGSSRLTEVPASNLEREGLINSR